MYDQYACAYFLLPYTITARGDFLPLLRLACLAIRGIIERSDNQVPRHLHNIIVNLAELGGADRRKNIMISRLIFVVVLIVITTIVGYVYLASCVNKRYPGLVNSDTKSAAIGLPVIQLALWCLQAFGFWSFMPKNPLEDGGRELYSSVLVNVRGLSDEVFYHLYDLQWQFFMQLLIFGGLAVLVIYTLVCNNKTLSQQAVKVLTGINTVFSAILVWGIISLTCLAFIAYNATTIPNRSTIIMILILIACLVIYYAVKMQISFNAAIPELMSAETFVSDGTKLCPYCGERIQAIAKKCKHCGEWLKEEEQIIVEKSRKKCPICGDEIDDSEIACPDCIDLVGDWQSTEMIEQEDVFDENETGCGSDSNNNKSSFNIIGVR